jgi:hypothetical protein
MVSISKLTKRRSYFCKSLLHSCASFEIPLQELSAPLRYVCRITIYSLLVPKLPMQPESAGNATPSEFFASCLGGMRLTSLLGSFAALMRFFCCDTPHIGCLLP